MKIAVTDGEAFLDACAALAMLSSPASDPPVARHYSLKKLESSVVAHCLTSQAAKVEGGGVGEDALCRVDALGRVLNNVNNVNLCFSCPATL